MTRAKSNHPQWIYDALFVIAWAALLWLKWFNTDSAAWFVEPPLAGVALVVVILGSCWVQVKP